MGDTLERLIKTPSSRSSTLFSVDVPAMPPSELPPGVPWLWRTVMDVVKPASAVYLAHYLLVSYTSWVISRRVFFLATLLGLPIKVIVEVWIDDRRRQREADALGARQVPRLRSRLPANLGVTMQLIKNIRTGYIVSPYWTSAQWKVFNLWIFWKDTICTAEPEHLKVVLATDFETYPKGPIFQRAMASILGTGVFNSDGDMWKFHRSITRPFFSRDRVTHFDIFDRHAQSAITLMKNRLQSGHPVDFQDLVSRFTLDSATEFLFGACVDTLSAGLPYPYYASIEGQDLHPGDVFARAMAEVLIIGRNRCMFAHWRMLEIFKDRTAEPMRIVNAFIEPILDRAIKRRRGEDGWHGATETPEGKKTLTVEDDDTLLDHLLRQTTDKIILRDEIINMLVAGRDTTASLLTFTVYALAMYPHVLEKLRCEILSYVGPTRAPTYEDIRNMKYLRATLNETLRLYPPVPVNIRLTSRATTLPAPPDDADQRPFHVPSGSEILYSVWVMHRRKDLWGEDAEVYDPERFIDERLQKYLVPNPFIFVPFNAGPRICLGQQFAYNEASFMLVKLLQAFSNVDLVPSAQPPGTMPPAAWANTTGRQAQERCFPKWNITLYANGGLWVTMKEAESS